MNNRIRYSLIIGLLILGICLTACNGEKTAPATPNPLQDVSAMTDLSGLDLLSFPTPQPADLRAMILEAFAAQDSLAWRYHSNTQLSNGETHTTLVEYQPPDRYHVVSDGKGGLIIYDDQVYALQDSSWVLSQIPISSIIDPDATKRLEDSISDITYLGSQNIDGKTMLVCKYKALQKTGDIDATIEVTLWIGKSDGLPYQLTVSGKSLAIDGMTGEVTGVDSSSTVVYEYDPNIQIDSPLP